MEVKIRPLEDNLYKVQFACLGDWERVMEEGPWTYQGNAMVIAPYEGCTKPSKVKVDVIALILVTSKASETDNPTSFVGDKDKYCNF